MPALHSIIEGQGPVIVLSHALGCDLHMWDEVAALLKDRYTVVRYDQRGHGQSPASAAAFTLQDLAQDAADLIDRLGRGPVHFAGVSMGGMTAQALAALHPDTVQSITIANSAARYDDAARQGWQARIDTVRTQGVAAIADGALQRWLSPDFVARYPQRVAQMRAALVQIAPEPYAQACAAVAGIALHETNASIRCPALVIGGTLDAATPMAMSEEIAAGIPGAELARIEAAHISCVEQPVAFVQLLDGFIQRA
ncbi:MAG: 3-oxoadipate enol-lactonase [Comamonas sp.]